MKAIGVCMVVCAIVAALADLIKGEQSQSRPPTLKPPRKRPSTQAKEER
jgi:hypothetical protein